MLFTSLSFLLFLPLVWLAFSRVASGWRWGVLLLASGCFYGLTRPANLLYLCGVTAVAWLGVAGMARARHPSTRRAVLVTSLLAVLGSLFGFKYYDFIADELTRVLAGQGGIELPKLGLGAPVGYSFYAFSAASLLIDAFAHRLPGPATARGVALYLAWFPKILAGPIERATHFLPQLGAGLRAEPERLVLGLQLILWGLCKKVLIADNLAPLVDKSFAIVAFASPTDLLIGVYAFAFQIYCDFSGYTDIAIGVSMLFGIELMENFRRPYLARSTAEFWGQRWHISLGRWFRDYLYLPLGGSRVGPWRHGLNLMLVFLVSGLWHAGLGYGVGWTFLIWGALNGAYQWAGVLTRPLWQRLGRQWPRLAASRGWAALRVLLTFHLITVSWVFFRAKSVADARLVFGRLADALPDLPAQLMNYPFSADHKLLAALVVGLLALEWFDERRSLFARLADASRAVRWAVWYVALALLLLLGRWQATEFIYMQF